MVATDGNACFDLAVGMMRTQAADATGSDVEEGVIVAIGYPNDDLYDQAGRCWDLTPPPGETYPASVRTGGAERFLGLLEQVLLPWVATRAHLDLRRGTLFGHSFGGLFALFALYVGTKRFSTYVAASPSLYWEDEAIKPFEDEFIKNGGMACPGTRVMLSAGEWEGASLAPHLRSRADMPALIARLSTIAKVRRAEDLHERLENAGLRASIEVFPGENHMSALAVALNRAVQATFSATRPLLLPGS